MNTEFDPAKDAANIAKHGVFLARAEEVEVEIIERDDRFDYGEPRFRAYSLLDDVPLSFAFTLRGERIRVLSLRRAHLKEYRRYVRRRHRNRSGHRAGARPDRP